MLYKSSAFHRLAKTVSRSTGHPAAFALAIAIVVAWLFSGPAFGFSDTWQLVINTGTTIVTFLMVFLIQNTQNRDGEAVQLKLDELIRAVQGAHNAVLDIEELTEQELDSLRGRYAQMARQAREDLRHGIRHTGSPDLPAERPESS
jgi:low affinity Fe/Cu permease